MLCPRLCVDTIDGRGSFVVNYGIGSVFDESRIVLSDFIANASVLGDFDFNGDVDGSDFLAWQRNPGIGALSDWQSNYGTQVPALAAETAIPEPTTLRIVFISIFAGNLPTTVEVDEFRV